MRTPNKHEVEEWLQLARDHGFVDDEDRVALGRYVVERAEGYSILI
jgi:hypothetical protein